MTTATTEAPAKLKFCRGCSTRLPIDRFRLMDKARGYRHSRCGDCRRESDRADKVKLRKSSANQFSRELNQLKTPAALLKLIGRFCDHLSTTPAGLFDDLAAYALSNDCSLSQRLKIAQAMLHIQATAELAQAQSQPKLDDPSAVLRELHRTHRLLPTLRAMYSEGAIGFDDLDPPPDAGGPTDEDF